MIVMVVQQCLLSVGCWGVFVDETAFVVLVNVSGWPLFLVRLIRRRIFMEHLEVQLLTHEFRIPKEYPHSWTD